MKTSRASKEPAARIPQLLRLVTSALDDKKAADLRVLDVREQSSITDFLILATGTSEPHLRALRLELEKVLDGAKATIVGVESAEGSGWTVFDAFEVMVHLFTTESRTRYRLELLWKDAVDIPLAKLLAKRARVRITAKRVIPKKRKR